MIHEITAFFNSGFEETVTVTGTGYSKTVNCIWETDPAYTSDGLGTNTRNNMVYVKESDFLGITIKPKDTVVKNTVTWYVQEITNLDDGFLHLQVGRNNGR